MEEVTFNTNVLMVTLASTDEMSEGYAIVESPRIVSLCGVPCLEARHSSDASGYIQGKRVLFPVTSISSITEFNSVDEALAEKREES